MTAPPLDISWIEEYEDIERRYEMFYKEPFKEINTVMIYINRQSEIVKISQKDISLRTENLISKNEIMEIVRDHSTVGETKYKILSLLTYNIDITHANLRKFLESDLGEDKFLHSLTLLDDIMLSPSIHLFHDINSLFIVYYEQPHPASKHNSTKKIFLRSKNTHKRNRKTKRNHD